MRSRLLLPCLSCALLMFAGCRDREITSYRAPKEKAPVTSAAGQLPADHPPIGTASPAGAPASDTMADTTVPTAGGTKLTWTAPVHWSAKALGSMRKGSFSIKSADGVTEADLSITAFPGDTGGLAANLNRWRGQVGLPPLELDALQSALEHVDANGLHFEIVEYPGTANNAPTTILGGILTRPGETWFFKLMGPAPLATAEKAAFREFLQTVKETR